MKRLIRRASSVLLLVGAGVGLLPSPAAAWGAEGHRIVARIAAAELPPAARTAVVSILQKDKHLTDCVAKEHLPVKTPADVLSCVATWADAVRNTPAYKFSRPFHFVNIPIDAQGFDAARDCPAAKGCVVSALEQYRQVLADKSRVRPERAEALKFIVHFMGDLHQPLHNVIDKDRDLANPENAGKNLPESPEGDRGGNTKIVTWFTEDSNQFGCWNLHAVWDDGMIDRRNLSIEKYAETLRSKITPAVRSQRAQGTLVDWVDEAFKLAVKNGYALPSRDQNDRVCEVRGPHNNECTPLSATTCKVEEVHYRYHLAQPYFDANIGTVEAQLTAAGIRLATILKEILK